ncbi:MAG: hypothetical protein HUU23_10510 [Caldilineales bacterium]|nr:hypothetical protein [Caldilineales bacterium]
MLLVLAALTTLLLSACSAPASSPAAAGPSPADSGRIEMTVFRPPT